MESDVLIRVIVPIILAAFPLLFSWIVGDWYQKSKINETRLRTQKFLQQNGRDIIHNTRTIPSKKVVISSGMVMANVSIGPSWWQMTISAFKSLIGGRLKYFETVMDFGRIEAFQRLREKAAQQGWDDVINVRMETAAVVSNKDGRNKSSAFEILVYGTGIRHER